MRWTRAAALSLPLVTVAQSAQAHIVAGEATGFSSGVLHPISGADHILAMVSVGMWGAQLGQPAIWILPVTFECPPTHGECRWHSWIASRGLHIGFGSFPVSYPWIAGLMVVPRQPPQKISSSS